MQRQVIATRKNLGGDIIALCIRYQNWSPIPKAEVIRDIKLGLHRYYVVWDNGIRQFSTDIHVVSGPNGEYLRTDKDGTLNNNLDELPSC